MNKLLLLFFLISAAACSTGPTAGTLTLHTIQTDTLNGATAPFDTLAAYRKYPGQPKTKKVRGYTRKDGRKVKGYERSGRV